MNCLKLARLSLCALGLAVLTSGSVFAQQPPATGAAPGAAGGARQGQRGGRAAVSLATMPVAALDALVTLDADQKTKIAAIQATLKTDSAAAAGDRQKMTELRTKANGEVKALLKEDQNKKLTELMPAIGLLVQSRAVPMTVLADVKLTADQWTKIKAAAKDATDKMAALAQEDRRTKGAEIRDAFKTTVEGLLTDDQKKIIEKAPKPAARAAGGAAPAPAAGNQ
jgi:hypothetical protein